MLKALPSQYKGTTFRSRLEADWALALDDRRIPWQYEPEGFELSDRSWYSPDFWLPSAKAWLEVKGDHDERLSKFETFAADLWAQADGSGRGAPLVLIGRAPKRDHPYDHNHGVISLMGVTGPGRGQSVGIVECASCDRGTVVPLWQDWCRGCGDDLGYPIRHGRGSMSWRVCDEYARPFRLLPRPAGRQG